MVSYTDETIRRRAEAENAMHATEGWRYLVEDLEESIAHHNTLEGVDDVADLWYRRGIVEGMRRVIARELLIDQLLSQPDA